MFRGRPRIVVALVAAVLPFGMAPIATDAAVVPTISALAAGERSTCALTSGGGVICWGYGRRGELGTGTTSTSLTPVRVAGLTTGVTAITAGGSHACALTSGGGVKCWGGNRFGELGNGSRTNSSTSVDVSSLMTGISAISAGFTHTCALTTDGGVKCWGYNGGGQLGNDTWINSSVPVDVAGLTAGVTAIAAGGQHTCALTSDASVTCWGANVLGQTGNPSSSSRIPVSVEGLASNVTAIAAGYAHICALATGGGVRCWGGSNGYGQLGHGTITRSGLPDDVSGLASGVAAISAGALHTCALLRGGGARCWGSNALGQLGAATGNSQVPVGVQGLGGGIRAVSAGMFHTCAISRAGRATCWGSNVFGQLGNGTRTSSRVPVAVDMPPS